MERFLKRYEDSKLVGIGYRIVKSWEATQSITYFYDNFQAILLSFT